MLFTTFATASPRKTAVSVLTSQGCMSLPWLREGLYGVLGTPTKTASWRM
jgi:hypothetical protein